MKRTQLQRYTPLRRTAWHRYGEIARQAWTRKRRNPAVPKAAKDALTARSNGWCEAGLPGCSRYATDPHHRQLTGMGGRHGAAKVAHDGLSGLLHLCRPCHDYATSPVGERRDDCLDTGLVVSQYDDPAEVPVTTPALVHLYGGPVLLSDDGGVWPADLDPVATRDTDPWAWLPNDACTRLHAVLVNACPLHPGEACGPAACLTDVDLTTVRVSGHQPPRCKRCLKVVDD